MPRVLLLLFVLCVASMLSFMSRCGLDDPPAHDLPAATRRHSLQALPRDAADTQPAQVREIPLHMGNMESVQSSVPGKRVTLPAIYMT
jgi:hypothetical protein